MSHSKRVSAPENGLQCLYDQEECLSCDENDQSESTPFVPYLSHITEGCSTREVDPTACVPFHLARGYSDNAVKRLKMILNGNRASSSEMSLTGMVSGPPSSIVVPLVGDLLVLLDEYLMKKHKKEEDRQAEKDSHEQWYGIIDGCHVFFALVELREDYPLKWGTFKWRVFVVRSGQEMSEYRKLAVVQNERSKQVYHYETTLFDLLSNLRRIHDDLYSKRVKGSRNGERGVNVFHRDVAEMYDGGDHNKNTTVRQAVSVASRITTATIEAIGNVANTTCAGIILNNGRLNKYNLTSTESILSRYDCRLFRKFLCTSTLRGARNFMNALKDGHASAQLNTIYRAKHWSENNDFKSVKPTVLNKLFKLSKQALLEEDKFLKAIGEQSWPSRMETNRDNLLRTTIYDDDIESNAGNEEDVMLELWKCFRRKYPGTAKGIEEAKKQAEAAASDTLSVPDPPPPDDLPDSTNDANNAEADVEKRKEEEKRRMEDERRASMVRQADQYLRQTNVTTHRLCFVDFARDEWTDSCERVDLILSAVPSDVDRETMLKLPTFCKSVLKTGSYIFLIVNEVQLLTLRESFQGLGFKVCDHPFIILYDTKTMRKRKAHDFPHRHFDIALIAMTQGIHPEAFVPEFVSSGAVDEVDIDMSTYASFSNVQNCTSKLKEPNHNTALFPDERSVELFSRVIRLLTPMEGTILDPFGGALSTSLACLETGRGCISMDQDNDRFRFALGRLRIFATPDATMEHHDVYTGPLIASDSSKAGVTDSTDNEIMSAQRDTTTKKRRKSNSVRERGRREHFDSDQCERSAHEPTQQKTPAGNDTPSPIPVNRRSNRLAPASSRRATRSNTTDIAPSSSLSDDNEEFTDAFSDIGAAGSTAIGNEVSPYGNNTTATPSSRTILHDSVPPVPNALPTNQMADVAGMSTLSNNSLSPEALSDRTPEPESTATNDDGDEKMQTADDFIGADALLSMTKSS